MHDVQICSGTKVIIQFFSSAVVGELIGRQKQYHGKISLIIKNVTCELVVLSLTLLNNRKIISDYFRLIKTLLVDEGTYKISYKVKSDITDMFLIALREETISASVGLFFYN